MHARRKDSMEYEGLLTGSQGEGPRLHLLARLSFPAYLTLAGSSNAGTWPPSQSFSTSQCWTIRQRHPRAPPMPAVALR